MSQSQDGSLTEYGLAQGLGFLRGKRPILAELGHSAPRVDSLHLIGIRMGVGMGIGKERKVKMKMEKREPVTTEGHLRFNRGPKVLGNFRGAALRPPSLMQGRGNNILKQVGIHCPTRSVLQVMRMVIRKEAASLSLATGGQRAL